MRRLLGHGLQADRLQVTGNQVVHSAGRPGFVIENLVQKHPGIAPERKLARQAVIEHNTQAVNVAARVGRVPFAPRLLRREIGGRTKNLALESQSWLVNLMLCQAEVGESRLAPWFD